MQDSLEDRNSGVQRLPLAVPPPGGAAEPQRSFQAEVSLHWKRSVLFDKARLGYGYLYLQVLGGADGERNEHPKRAFRTRREIVRNDGCDHFDSVAVLLG